EPQAARQVAIADRLIVTTTDLAPDGIDPRLAARIRAINARATQLCAIRGEIEPGALIGNRRSHELTYELTVSASEDAAAHDTDIACISIRRDEPLPALALPLLLEALADHIGADLLRLKAIVHVAEHPEQPAVLHGVQHLFHEPQWLE